jgi:aspartate/methionine/tyrosine aminotransferase
MQLKPFSLDMWLNTYEHDVEFNLAASTGPPWKMSDLLDLAGDTERQRFLDHWVTYGHGAGNDGLRVAIAEMHAVEPEAVQIVTGASEALVILSWLAAEPGANVVLPQPGFPTFSALPESLGLETRFYRIRKESGFRIDVEEIEALADARTKYILINSPHNPTGATIDDAEMERLHAFTSARGIQLVSDEVYHPIYHGPASQSAARFAHATTIGDFSKAFPLAGTRTGWMIEADPVRRQRYWNARTYFSVCNSSAGELLAEIAVRNRAHVLRVTQETASRNLAVLDAFMAEHRERFGWIRPRGGMTAFPWFHNGESARPFCQAAAETGVLLVPGDCFDAPEHFRLSFATMGDGFAVALQRLSETLVSR